MITFSETVVASNTTTDIAFYICVLSFMIAGGVAIYLLWDKIHASQTKKVKPRIVRAKVAKSSVKKSPVKNKSAAKRVTKKTATRTAKRK